MSSQPSDGGSIETEMNGPSAHAHGPQYDHGCTLTRRQVMQQGAAAGATIAATGAASSTAADDNGDDDDGSRWETRMCWYSGTDEYDCYAERAVSDAANWLLGSESEERDPVQEYESLERLALWASSMRRHLSNSASADTLTITLRDFADFSPAKVYLARHRFTSRSISVYSD